MKRILFIAFAILFLAAPFTGRSQHQYYFNEGDTIYGRDTTYHYQWWSEQWLASDPLHKLGYEDIDLYWLLHGRVARYCYTEQPLNIIGIATTLYNCCIDGQYAYEHGLPEGWGNPCDVPPDKQEYLILYEADTFSRHNRFYEVGRIPFDYTKPARYLNLDLRHNNNVCCNIAPNFNKIVKIREYYFDKPITVYDSFYVGHTLNTNFWPDPEYNDYWHWGVTCFSIGYQQPNPNTSGCPADELNCESIPIQTYKWKQDDFMISGINVIDSSVWYYAQVPQLILEFPIILIDSSFFYGPPQYVCPQATNFRIANTDIDDRKVVLLWDTHGDHQSWQISYGPAGTAPDDGTIINCPMQVGQIMNLDTCTEYVAYVRAVCNHDSIVYSEWSDSLLINVCDTTGGGTGRIDATSAQFVQLMPNPASEQVQVISSFGISGIEVYDLQGRLVLETENGRCNTPRPSATPLREGTADAAEGTIPTALSAQFSVSGWLPGLYIAVVHTPAGNFAKKLAVK